MKKLSDILLGELILKYGLEKIAESYKNGVSKRIYEEKYSGNKNVHLSFTDSSDEITCELGYGNKMIAETSYNSSYDDGHLTLKINRDAVVVMMNSYRQGCFEQDSLLSLIKEERVLIKEERERLAREKEEERERLARKDKKYTLLLVMPIIIISIFALWLFIKTNANL